MASTWDAEELQMLKASYREVTGRSIPPYLSPDDALAELRRLLPVITAEEEDSQATLGAILAAAKLKQRFLAAQARRKEKAAILAAAKDAGWDEDAYAMLQSSYREVTGRALPRHLSPDAAMAELRGTVPNVSDTDPRKVLGAIVAGLRLKKLLRHAALHRSSSRGSSMSSERSTTASERSLHAAPSAHAAPQPA